MTVPSAQIAPRRASDVAQLVAIATRVFLLLGIVVDIVQSTLPFLPAPPVFVLRAFGVGHLLVRLGTMTTFLTWLYLRYSALTSLGWGSTNYRPAMAIGWFFVPVMNLFKPYTVVQEVWGATEREGSSELGRSPLVLAWWLTFVGAPITLFLMGRPSTLRARDIVIVNVINIIAAVLASRMIQQLELRWKAKTSALVDSDDGWEPVEPVPLGDDPAKTIPLSDAAAVLQTDVAPQSPPIPRPPAPAPPGNAPVSPPPARPVTSAPSPQPSAASVRPDAGTPASVPPAPAPSPVAMRATAPATRPSAPPANVEPVATPTRPSEESAMAELRDILPSLRKLATGIAILGAVSVAMMVCGSVFFVATSWSGPAVMKHAATLVALLYVGMGLMYLVPVTHQLRFAAAIRRFDETGKRTELATALRMQGRFWAFTGGLIAILLAVEVVGIAAAIIIPNVMRLIRS